MSILFPKTSKKFYHHIKFRKSIMNRRCSIKAAVLKNSAIFMAKHMCRSLFLIKLQVRPNSKTQVDEKKLAFSYVLYHLVVLYFSTAYQVAFGLHNKNDSSEGL